MKVSRPWSGLSLPNLATIVPPPRTPSKLPVPLTTSQTALWTGDSCVGEKRICKRPPGQWNVVRIVGPVLRPLVLPPGQNADSPMRDPLRTSPVWCTYSLGDARLAQDRRRRVTSYAEQVTVGPAVRGRNRFDPDRVTIEWRQR